VTATFQRAILVMLQGKKAKQQFNGREDIHVG